MGREGLAISPIGGMSHGNALGCARTRNNDNRTSRRARVSSELDGDLAGCRADYTRLVSPLKRS